MGIPKGACCEVFRGNFRMFFLTRWANYLTRAYLATPASLRWLFWVLPIIYILMPVDFMPDPIFGVGRLDDLLVALFVFWALDRAISLKGFFKEAGSTRRQEESGEHRGQAEKVARQQPHQVLGISAKAASSEIKKAYRKMLNRYHPDKFAHLGEEFEMTAKRRTQEIIAAYKEMMAGRR